MECSFCSHEIAPGTGKTYVTKQGKIFHFCSSKCEKNMFKLKRKPRRVQWTETYRAEKAIRIKS
ncbi:MAG: 50S ribosomal protein L24e [Candidatus Altiarchaeales archaeon HGW-Altiarchaeales-3]|nr:MAG: 50S ribosomal protein L24e [Candidatus Altiarchaeales archaeon HGW-Altiarchaeales-3]